MSSGMRSKLYVSSSIETTAGTAATVNKRFRFNACDIKRMYDDKVIEEVTGYDAPVDTIRERSYSGGTISKYLHPDFAAWAFKMAFGASPSSATVSPSSTVYEHTNNAFADQPATFTVVKKIGEISSATEKFPGCGVTKIDISSKSGLIDMTVTVAGMGLNYEQGVSDPGSSVVTSGERPMVGMNSNIYINGTALGTGDLTTDWKFSLDLGQDIQDSAGGTDDADGSVGRFH